MATTITAGNATNGAAVSSDNTGTLQIKTGSGAGTTAISIDASQAVTMPGPVAIPGNLVVTGTITSPSIGGGYILNQYVAPATWTKPTGLKSVKVTIVGAGGTASASAGTSAGGGGGGAGGTAIYYASAPSIPGPVAVTAGPGTNSFGALASATAGSSGGPATPSSAGAGGAGGSGSGGTVNVTGGTGTPGLSPFTGTNNGRGGASSMGGPGAYGSGGNASSGAGTAGIVIVEEFY